MTQQDLALLLKRFQLGLCSPEEMKALEDWYNHQYETSDYSWDELDRIAFKNNLDRAIDAELKESNQIFLYRKSVLKFSIAALIATFLLGSAVWIHHQLNKESATKQSSIALRYKNDVAPGKVGAIWHLNENTINLERSENNAIKQFDLAEQRSTELIFKPMFNASQNTFLNTINTQKGQQYKVTLADGTKIWLNAASSISFLSPFEKNKRVVKLTGEAYFEVAPNKQKPFIVIHNQDSVKVLGTHFNINSYEDEPYYAATLLQGSIAYSDGMLNPLKVYVLKPNEQIERQKNTITIHHLDDIENKVAWKEGYFSFSNETIESVMRQLSRWYSIDVVYNSHNYTEKFFGYLRKDAPLSSILSVLEKSGVQFLIKGNKVTVL